MREACKVAREVLDTATRQVRAGVTTDELDRIVHETCIDLGAYPSPLNYYNFPKSVCASVNECVCHGIPDRRELESGDIVNLDVTCYYNGYHGDLNETHCVGKVTEEHKRLVKTAHDCMMSGKWGFCCCCLGVVAAARTGKFELTEMEFRWFLLFSSSALILKTAIAMVKPGVRFRDLGSPISKLAKKNGFSVVR